MEKLLNKYYKKIIPFLKKEFNYSNIMQVPKLTKVVINMGVGRAIENKNFLDSAIKELAIITAQQPVKTFAKKSIANFKLREGNAIGCKVTLRGKRMYEFVYRLINIALPRVRDFRGVPYKSFDGSGNYSLGIKEHIIFPEINYDKVIKMLGMDITFVTNSKNDDEAKILLKEIGIPFKNK